MALITVTFTVCQLKWLVQYLLSYRSRRDRYGLWDSIWEDEVVGSRSPWANHPSRLLCSAQRDANPDIWPRPSRNQEGVVYTHIWMYSTCVHIHVTILLINRIVTCICTQVLYIHMWVYTTPSWFLEGRGQISGFASRWAEQSRREGWLAQGLLDPTTSSSQIESHKPYRSLLDL